MRNKNAQDGSNKKPSEGIYYKPKIRNYHPIHD